MEQRVQLRKLRMSDLERIFELFANDNVLKYLSSVLNASEVTRKKEKAWLQKVLTQYRQRKPEEYNMAITVNGELIGSIGIKKADYENKKAEIGYWIGEPYWGKGYTSEAVKQITGLLFKRFGFVRLEAGVYHPNIASQKVLKKSGYQFEGTKRKSIRKGNQCFDEKLYAIVR